MNRRDNTREDVIRKERGGQRNCEDRDALLMEAGVASEMHWYFVNKLPKGHSGWFFRVLGYIEWKKEAAAAGDDQVSNEAATCNAKSCLEWV